MGDLEQKENKKFKRKNISGQGMVEFVFILFLVMILCAGMLYVGRLLTFDYWAQQEARYYAFEQTWAAKEQYADVDSQVKSTLDNSQFLRRPSLLQRLDIKRESEGTDDIISDTFSLASITKADSANSIWKKSSKDLFPDRDNFSIIESAYAAQDKGKKLGYVTQGIISPRDHFIPRSKGGLQSRKELGEALVSLMENLDVGGEVCAGFRGFQKRNSQLTIPWDLSEDCASGFNRDFGYYLGENLDISSMFRDYGFQIESGFTTKEALEISLRKEISGQFYSFFDASVNIARVGSIPAIITNRVDPTLAVTSQSYFQLLADLRYLGSALVLATITGSTFGVAFNPDALTYDYAGNKASEDLIAEVLHADAAGGSSGFPFNGYFLNPLYLPVPPTLGPAAPGFFNAIMENVLAGEDGDVMDDLMNEANKNVRIDYLSEKGLFGGARRRFKTEGRVLTARFLLVTQPWHITRRESPDSDYRDLGDQFDDRSEPTEEGILRRRVLGLWLFPSQPSAFLRPITDIGGIGEAVAPFLDVLNIVDDAVSQIKVLLTDNPILDIANFLSQVPFIGDLVPTIPYWPAVRPTAYPGSTEMDGDRLTGSNRNFSDYITEQEKYDPEPNPEFN